MTKFEFLDPAKNLLILAYFIENYLHLEVNDQSSVILLSFKHTSKLKTL